MVPAVPAVVGCDHTDYGKGGRPLADGKVVEALERISDPRTRMRMLDFVEKYRAADPALSLAAATAKAVADPRWGPRGMTRITLVDGGARSEPEGLWEGKVKSREVDGVVWGFRGDPKAAIPSDGNAIYQVWRILQGKGREKWEARVVTQFALTACTFPSPPAPGAELVMELRKNDILLLPTVGGGALFFVKKMKISRGRVYLWPLRFATGEKTAPLAQGALCALGASKDVNLNLGKAADGLEFTAEGLRKAAARPATVTPLGRVRPVRR